MRARLRRWLVRIVPDLGADPRGVTVLEILIAMAILVVALVALYGLVSNAIRSFSVSEDFLDVQQNARVALEKFEEEARWTTGLVTAANYNARIPVTSHVPCTPELCPDRVIFNIPRGNPIVQDCAYYVLYRRKITNEFVREVKPDPNLTDNPTYGTGSCVSSSENVMAAYVTQMVYHYCSGATPPVCTSDAPPDYGRITLAQVVRVDGDITVTKSTGGVTRTRSVGTDVLLRNAGAAGAAPTASPSPTSPPRPTITRPFLTPTETATETATVTPTATFTITPTATVTPTETFTVTPTPTETATETVTVTPTATATVAPTPTETATTTVTPTATVTVTPTATRTPTATVTPTATFTITPTATVTATETPTMTPTPTETFGK